MRRTMILAGLTSLVLNLVSFGSGAVPLREDSSRVAAMLSGQFDITHHFPAQFISQAKAAPMLSVTPAKPNFQLLYFGFKITRPMVADKRVREAMSIAINRAELASAMLLGNAEPALTIVHKDALDHDPKTADIVSEERCMGGLHETTDRHRDARRGRSGVCEWRA